MFHTSGSDPCRQNFRSEIWDQDNSSPDRHWVVRFPFLRCAVPCRSGTGETDRIRVRVGTIFLGSVRLCARCEKVCVYRQNLDRFPQ